MPQLYFGFRINFAYDGLDDMTLEELMELLAVKEREQEFELCAKIRDRIKELKADGKGDKPSVVPQK